MGSQLGDPELFEEVTVRAPSERNFITSCLQVVALSFTTGRASLAEQANASHDEASEEGDARACDAAYARHAEWAANQSSTVGNGEDQVHDHVVFENHAPASAIAFLLAVSHDFAALVIRALAVYFIVITSLTK